MLEWAALSEWRCHLCPLPSAPLPAGDHLLGLSWGTSTSLAAPNSRKTLRRTSFWLGSSVGLPTSGRSLRDSGIIDFPGSGCGAAGAWAGQAGCGSAASGPEAGGERSRSGERAAAPGVCSLRAWVRGRHRGDGGGALFADRHGPRRCSSIRATLRRTAFLANLLLHGYGIQSWYFLLTGGERFRRTPFAGARRVNFVSAWPPGR